MSRDTFPNAITELFGLLASTSGVPVADLRAAGIVKVYDHEPKPGDTIKGAFVTVATAGMDPDFWLIAQRIYVTFDVSASLAQSTIIAGMVAIDKLMTAGFGPSEWRVEAVPEIEAFVATNFLRVGRQDYY